MKVLGGFTQRIVPRRGEWMGFTCERVPVSVATGHVKGLSTTVLEGTHGVDGRDTQGTM